MRVRVPPALLGRGRIHPALHIDGHGVVLGYVTADGVYQLVTSEPAVYAPKDAKKVLALEPRPYADLSGRWPDEDLEAFVASNGAPLFSEVLTHLIHELDAAMEFPRPEHHTLVAVWALATYFHPLFRTFPVLRSRASERVVRARCSPSSRRGVQRTAHAEPTPACAYRLVQEFKPTLLLDEMEGLSKNDARDVLAIINSGYKAGGTVARCEGKDEWHVKSFAVYAPLAMAAIKAVNAVTEDRCIPLVLQRGTDLTRVNAEMNPGDKTFAEIRGGCYRLVLTCSPDVRQAYSTVSIPAWLNGRARELWHSLLAIAALADREGGLALTADLLALAREHAEDRGSISAEGEAVISVLERRLGSATEVVVRPSSLVSELRVHLGWSYGPSPEQVAAWLRRLGIPKAKPPRDRHGMRYEVSAGQLVKVRARYGLP